MRRRDAILRITIAMTRHVLSGGRDNVHFSCLKFLCQPVFTPLFQFLAICHTLIRVPAAPALRRLATVSILALVTAACSPEYNWRELDVADGQARAAFPARAQSDSRVVAIGEAMTPFTMTTATVNDALFAIGHATLPADIVADAARRHAMAQSLLRAAYVNLNAEPPAQLPVDGTVVVVRGEGARAGSWSMVRVWSTPTALIEAIAIGTDQTLPEARAREFVDQVVLTR